LGVKDIADHKQEIRGVHHFIDNLKELPLTEREFALNLAQRMHRRRKRSLPAEDVMGAFQLSAYALRRHMSVLEDHQLGSIDEQGQVTLSERERRSNPWIEILEFCEKTGGAVAGCVGIRRDVISGALRVPSQAARSIG
jgi:hypothetical protein